MTKTVDQLSYLIIPRNEAKGLLLKQIDEGHRIASIQGFDYDAITKVENEYLIWTNYNVELLRRIFSDSSVAEEYVKYLTSISYCLDGSLIKFGVEKATTKMEAISNRLELIPEKVRFTSTTPAFLRVMKILSRFHVACKQLEERQRDRPPYVIGDEYDVQDFLYALLKIDFDNIIREDSTPKVAGASSHMDMLLKSEQIVIEAKMTRNGLNVKKLGEELLLDIKKYKEHKDCKTLICFIYDPTNRLKNPAELKNDLEKESSEEMKVSVCIYPS